MSTDEIKEMLNNETWFTASEAFEKVLQTLMKRKPKKKKITSYLNSNYSISQKIDVENEIKEIKIKFQNYKIKIIKSRSERQIS